ncbi:hypothetical protein HY993_03060 [Candidatus Micrarchaeota archaeon]|nr:hypothetical protein [Candidatus Micrarchaeota archaeon]
MEKIIKERIELLKRLDKIASKSKLTEKDVQELGDKIRKGMAKRHKLGSSLSEADKLASKSKLTRKDVDELADLADSEMADFFKKKAS